MTTETVDLAVVGAGWAGLVGAKTFLQVHPNAKIVILDDAASVGGTWASERLYPTLRSNNLLGTFEYPDFPMRPSEFPVHPGQPIPGKVIHDYLVKYTRHFGIEKFIRCQTRVTKVSYDNEKNIWTLSLEKLEGGVAYTIIANKVIIATGLTNQPFVPYINGSETFQVPIFHHKELSQYADTLSSTPLSSVTILGGAKSAYDAVYLFASQGIKVHWVIRSSGMGPIWMAPPYVTPFKRWAEKLVNTRIVTWMSPCIWGDADGYVGIRKWLHGTWFGRKVVDTFWWVLSNDVCTLNKYDAHPETRKLKPWSSAFWIASSFSILNYPTDFYDLVRSGIVKVHISDIDHLSPRTVHLTSEPEPIQTDALICCTGWKYKPRIRFYPEGIEKQLGVPYHDPNLEDFGDDPLVKRADEVILSRFPRLRDQPAPNPHYKPMTPVGVSTSTTQAESMEPNRPYRLYRLIAPPTHAFRNSIVFLGASACFSLVINAHIQSLWAVAYFNGKIPGLSLSPSPGFATPDLGEDELLWDATLTARFGRWRYPTGYGRRFPDFVADVVPYWDLILGDLGLESKCKGGGLREVFDPYGPEDFRTIVEEWIAKHRHQLTNPD